MSRNHRHSRASTLAEKYPPSPPCACPECQRYCLRPGWWTVAEARLAVQAGLADRMMLEISPERTCAVLSPAFKGCERYFALQEFSANGCTFWIEGNCQLHGSALQPLECRFCHHERPGLGAKCHADLEKDWDTPAGRALIQQWLERAGLWSLRRLTRLDWLD
jgi:hypothetical protein